MSAFLTIAVIHLLAVSSPGPDFAFITKQSLAGSRRNAVLGSVGLGLGILMHCVYCIMGLGVIIAQSVIVFNVLKYISAGYLIYIGWKSLTHKSAMEQTNEGAVTRSHDLPATKAIAMGFVCNALNPKATMFFLAVFTQVIEPSTPIVTQGLYALYMGFATFVWFSFLSSVFTLKPVRKAFARFQSAIERTMGAVLMALGVRVAFVSQE